MQRSTEVKKQIIESLLNTVTGISDKEYQIRVWIIGDPKIFDNFDETCCNFFSIGDPVIEQYKDYGLTEAQYSKLKSFRDEFDEFIRKNYWPPDFIDTPEWAKIMDMAKDVLKAFAYQKPW